MSIKKCLDKDMGKFEQFLTSALLFVTINLTGAAIILAAGSVTFNSLAYLDVPYVMLIVMGMALMASVVYYMMAVYVFGRKRNDFR